MISNSLHITENNKHKDVIGILIVDDNANNLKLLRTLLTEKGFKVRLATSGQMAINSCLSSIPDMILLDITMPGMDGFEVCNTIKKHKEMQNVPVIFLSALKDEFDIVRGFSVGGVDFVTKPFKSEVLLARINTHLTINRLQNDLKRINENLEVIIDERTKVIQETNVSLKGEIESHINTQKKLSESENLYRLTLANLDDTVIIITNTKGDITYISPSYKNIFDRPNCDVDKPKFSTFFNIGFINENIPRINNNLQVFETTITKQNGDTCSLIVSAKSAFIQEEVIIYTCRDITLLKEAQSNLFSSEERLKYALLASNEGIFDWDVESDSLIRNNTYYEMLGYELNDLPKSTGFFIDLIHPEDKKYVLEGINEMLTGNLDELKSEFRVKKKNGDYCWILSKSMVVEKNEHGTPARIIGTQTDITHNKQHEEHLKKLASYDSLTKLPNRNFFINMLKSAIARGERKYQQHAMLFLDLDRFKNINDSLGHTAGDNLLQKVSVRLNDIIRGNDIVARLGGDEYTILLEDIDSSHKAAEISQRIIEILNAPFDIEGHQVVITPSIGIVLYPTHGLTPEELLKKADTAMYHAKSLGGNNYWYFTESMNHDAHYRLEMEESMRNAITHDEFKLYYQPKVNLQSREIVGMEALIRWGRIDKELVGPDIFIPIAEETGLIIPIGNQILEIATQQIKTWKKDDLLKHKVAINISAIQFRQADFIDNIKSTLNKYDLSPEYIELEITEAVVMDNTDEAIIKMEKLKNIGISLAMDDFGTGYSSLSYLKKFPIDTLKIDMSFIKDMNLTQMNKSIVKTIIDLAHTLKLEVIAEGVEEKAQIDALNEMGCDTVQGYFYSAPVDSEAFTDLLVNKTIYK